MVHAQQLPLQTSPLLQFLFHLRENELCLLAQEHGLGGFLYRFRDHFNDPNTRTQFLKAYQQQMQKNILFMDEFKKLNTDAKKHLASPLTPLKGLSLLQRVHQIGERSLTDMDIYTSLPADRFTTFFLRQGYHFVQEKKWHYNKHKWVFYKNTSVIDFNLEVHTQLLPQDQKKVWPTNEEGLLLPQDEFLYLCAHWAQQHTCLKLFWLLDLHFYLQKNSTLWNDSLWQKAKALRIHQSLLAAYWALKLNFNVNLALPTEARPGSDTLQALMRPKSLAYLYKNRWRYLLLKHLLKDSFLETISYDFQWTLFQLDSVASSIKRNFTKDL